MLLLPTFNATLNPCPVSPTEFIPHAQGNFCGQCQRVVHDFSRSTNPRADLAAARAAAPDGRVCGTFRREQLLKPSVPTLRGRLRWFVVALVLVVALTAQEALAQVRRVVPKKPAVHHKKHPPATKKQPVEGARIPEEPYYTSGVPLNETMVEEPVSTTKKVYTYVEQMPELPGGGGIQAIVANIQQRLRWPLAQNRTTVEGRVYASFIVDKNGMVRDAKIIKGLIPSIDEEALRVIQTLPVFTPGQQGGQRVAVSFTVPITFKLK
jgi:TonB family protein